MLPLYEDFKHYASHGREVVDIRPQVSADAESQSHESRRARGHITSHVI